MRKLFFLFALLFVFSSIKAAYFERLPYTITQPNGKTINCFVSGDEYFNWLHDKDGYTIIQADNGYYYYAIKENDVIKPSKYLVNSTNPEKAGLKKWLKISKEEYLHRRNEMSDNEKNIQKSTKAPHNGILNNLVVYIRFSDDSEFTINRQEYDDKFNPTTGISLKSYYNEVSYNNLTINSTHYPECAFTTNLSYQDYHPRSYFQPYNAGTNPNGYIGSNMRREREHQLLADAIDWININSPVPGNLNLDGDNDNKIDNMCFIIRGNSGAWSNLLWAHRWSLTSQDVYINGKKVYDYTFQPENQVNVRTLCHEMFHALGAPDLYHYNDQGTISPVGSWDLMESGGGHMLAYMKWRYSNKTWINSIPEITTSGTYSLNPITMPLNNCYKIKSPYSVNEYFMVEYRIKTGMYESFLPGTGLIVYRIDTLLNGNASGPPDGVYIYRPGGSVNANGNINSANFSANVNRTSINDTTNPFSFLQSGGNGGLNIYNISYADTTISFDVIIPSAICLPPDTQSTAFSANVLSSSAIKINFTRGNGDSVLIIARANNPVNITPINGSLYQADSVFGNGVQLGSGNYVLYNGSNNQITFSSLSSGTTYHFAVFEYNATTKCYKTPALTGSAITPCIPLSIISQPTTSQTFCSPSPNTVLTVGVSGSLPINYKWQYKNGNNWTNVNNDTPIGSTYTYSNTAALNIKDIAVADTHQYRVTLSNCNQQYRDTSNISKIIVNLTPPVPVITQSADTLFSSSLLGNQWYSYAGGLIAGATSNILLPQNTDNYYVIVKINNCIAPNKSNVIYFNNTNIDENDEFDSKIIISPNPFNEFTKIEYQLEDSKFVEFTLTDISGKEIFKTISGKQQKGLHSFSINSGDLNSGMYIYKLKIGEKINMGKMIKL